MPNQEEIAHQQSLLVIYRRRLADYLKQHATQGAAYAAPSVLEGIRETRDQIQRIKGILRGWCIPIEDLPDDEPLGTAFTKPHKRVFISYKRDTDPDTNIALQVFQALSQQHLVFLDQTMPIGTRWAERIKAEICQSDIFIAMLSSSSILSQMVEEEIALAHRFAEAQGGRPVILPVRLAYRMPFQYPLSAYLNEINWAFWDGPRDTLRLIEELTRAVDGGELSIATLQSKVELLDTSDSSPLPQPTASAQLVGRWGGPTPLELPSGTMDPQSAFYVERSSDIIALETIQRHGGTINIKGPRQMGKSSLLIRVIDTAINLGKRVAFLDFQLFDHTALESADLFFRQFCVWLNDTLELEDRIEDYWSRPLSNIKRCTSYVERHILPGLGGPLVLAMDEVERIFEADFRSDFFSMLRSWHNSRVTSPFRQLDLVLVTSTEPYLLIKNLNQSPFNVGEVIDLEDFTPEQVADLNHRHGTPLTSHDQQRLVDLLGGHPYLVRRALYLIASGRSSTDNLFAKAIADDGPFGDHLRYHLFRLHGRSELIQGMLQVLRSHECPDEQVFFRLRGAGLVRREGRAVLPRCRLYAEFFGERLHE